MIKMNERTIVIIYLSLSLLFCQWRWMEAEKRSAYLQGKLDEIHYMIVDDNGEGIHKAVPKGEKW